MPSSSKLFPAKDRGIAGHFRLVLDTNHVPLSFPAKSSSGCRSGNRPEKKKKRKKGSPDPRPGSVSEPEIRPGQVFRWIFWVRCVNQGLLI
ncbi:uncharacterized protein LOC126601347 isoform X2 [Malus sylvestris]|uniref:uncharacterized protein LOC126601347 isoform X2 n=1 Tax=Malus sylvestris TaxID=3752 RepID=UPI0021AD1C92|nr:uncharacterized protein LOC126601347 isoform X2 [Malus sylvestris]